MHSYTDTPEVFLLHFFSIHWIAAHSTVQCYSFHTYNRTHTHTNNAEMSGTAELKETCATKLMPSLVTNRRPYRMKEKIDIWICKFEIVSNLRRRHHIRISNYKWKDLDLRVKQRPVEMPLSNSSHIWKRQLRSYSWRWKIWLFNLRRLIPTVSAYDTRRRRAHVFGGFCKYSFPIARAIIVLLRCVRSNLIHCATTPMINNNNNLCGVLAALKMNKNEFNECLLSSALIRSSTYYIYLIAPNWLIISARSASTNWREWKSDFGSEMQKQMWRKCKFDEMEIYCVRSDSCQSILHYSICCYTLYPVLFIWIVKPVLRTYSVIAGFVVPTPLNASCLWVCVQLCAKINVEWN